MTYEEAKILCRIVSTADNECAYCVSSLMEQIVKEWPEIEWRKAFDEGTGDSGGEWIVRDADRATEERK